MMSRSFQTTLRYRPLSPDQSEIRLLEVYPAKSFDEPIRSRLYNVPLTDEVNYIGLSLLYGDAAITEVIYVNGQSLRVPSSIGQALRDVRTKFTSGEVLDNLFLDPQGSGSDRQSTFSRWTTKSSRPSTGVDSLSATAASLTDSLSSPTRPVESNNWKRASIWLKNMFRSVRSKRPRDFQTNNQPLRVWLDALCTNGQDAYEMSRRRSTTALAYREARLVVGWLGPKDEEAFAAVMFITTLANAAPPLFGDRKHRRAHPEHCKYHQFVLSNSRLCPGEVSRKSSAPNHADMGSFLDGPIMEFLKPLERMWDVAPGARVEDHPGYQGLKNFLARPYFCNNWILEELALSRHPGFLVGDMFVSCLQILRFICICEEVVEKGSVYFPDEERPLLNYLPLGSVYIFLEEYDRRRAAQFELDWRGDTIQEVEGRHVMTPPYTAISGRTLDLRKAVSRGLIRQHTHSGVIR